MDHCTISIVLRCCSRRFLTLICHTAHEFWAPIGGRYVRLLQVDGCDEIAFLGQSCRGSNFFTHRRNFTDAGIILAFE